MTSCSCFVLFFHLKYQAPFSKSKLFPKGSCFLNQSCFHIYSKLFFYPFSQFLCHTAQHTKHYFCIPLFSTLWQFLSPGLHTYQTFLVLSLTLTSGHAMLTIRYIFSFFFQLKLYSTTYISWQLLKDYGHATLQISRDCTFHIISNVLLMLPRYAVFCIPFAQIS